MADIFNTIMYIEVKLNNHELQFVEGIRQTTKTTFFRNHPAQSNPCLYAHVHVHVRACMCVCDRKRESVCVCVRVADDGDGRPSCWLPTKMNLTICDSMRRWLYGPNARRQYLSTATGPQLHASHYVMAGRQYILVIGPQAIPYKKC